ncbi:MAG TPA: ThiF family adenylyltransferase [Ktedonobacterales bacterium]|jgi:tRNA A37 threonylcarbamoyladenosine dehydratase|nr:ThiF family adenylyltransferase [Ktedonobacterales bacterium]
MPEHFLHESLYRGEEAVERMGAARIVVCGGGALGSHLTENLVRQGVRHLAVIDDDRVEAHNIGTQVYEEGDIGVPKAEVLRARGFRAAGVEIVAITKRLTEQNVAKLLRDADLVCDTFDNSASRGLVTVHCREHVVACLHLGVNADYGEVRWNEVYRVPGDVLTGNACDYPLARNLVLFVVALGGEAIARFLVEGERQSYSFTLRDLTINRE